MNTFQKNYFYKCSGTCLINSVQSPELVKYLLDHGADVDAGILTHILNYFKLPNCLNSVLNLSPILIVF